jgi:hypothetical protein
VRIVGGALGAISFERPGRRDGTSAPSGKRWRSRPLVFSLLEAMH